MLFKMIGDKLEPSEFLNMENIYKLEKDLENILSINMFDALFEGNPIFVIFQERPWQGEPDIIALDISGNIIIFELKRTFATGDTLGQLFRYAQIIQKWTYDTLQQKFRLFKKDKKIILKEFHKENFNLSESLSEDQFNRKQKMIIVGNSADVELIEGIDYWKKSGIDIDFIPYRIFKINLHMYFELFAKPYDIHSNSLEIKGVMFDTNRTWDENGLQYMLDKKRISSWGDRKEAIYALKKGDYVFYSHKWVGIVAAGIVKGKVQSDQSEDELYFDVDFKTPLPEKVSNEIKKIPFNRISEITGKTFFWARIDKRPFLTKEESEKILKEMIKEFNKS